VKGKGQQAVLETLRWTRSSFMWAMPRITNRRAAALAAAALRRRWTTAAPNYVAPMAPTSAPLSSL
jgi:hypothetical protein